MDWNWEAAGAIGELIGAVAVVVTLVILAVQIRMSTRALHESNRLERAAAIDRHTDSVSRWRGMIASNEGLAQIYLKGLQDKALTDLESVRLNNIWVNFVNTQRSNFERAHVVNEMGLATQAAKSIAVEMFESKIMLAMWERAKPWHNLASPGFTAAVDGELKSLADNPGEFKSGSWMEITEMLRLIGEEADTDQ